jgi:hypothetical protein
VTASPGGPRRPLGVHAAVIAFSVLLALAYTWPLARHLGTHYVVRQPPPARMSVDLLLTSWMLASDVRLLVRDPLRVFETNNLHPFRHTLAFSENLLGVALFLLPVQLLGDNPTLTHNVAMLLALVVTGWGTFLLVHELGGSRLAAMLTAALVVYSPAMWANVILLPLMAGHWIPVALFLLVRLVRAPSWRTSGLLGLVVALQLWSSLHHGFFLAVGLGATAPLVVVLTRSWRALPRLAAAGALAGALAVPLFIPYRAVRTEMDLEERPGAARFALELERVTPPLDRPFGYLVERLRSGERIQTFANLTPWLALGAGAIAAALGRGHRPEVRILAALAAGGFANLLLALGPQGHPWLPNPYPLLAAAMPGLAWLRVPMRAITYAHFILCVVAGSGLAVLLRRLRAPTARALVALATLMFTVLEAGWRPIPLAPAPPRRSAVEAELRTLDAGCAIAELPATLESSGVALFRSTSHWLPLVNGYSGFHPLGLFGVFSRLNRFPAPDALEFLHEAGACAVVVHREMRDFAAVVAASHEHGMPVHATDSEVLIRLPPPPPPPTDGPSLSHAGWKGDGESGLEGERAFDGDLDTVWRGTVDRHYGADRLTVDLGEMAMLSALAIELGHHVRLYLRSYRIEGSADGQTWATLAESTHAIPPLASYRANPRRVRQRVALPATPVRWLRLGPYRRPPSSGLAPDVGWTDWGVAELQAYRITSSHPR